MFLAFGQSLIVEEIDSRLWSGGYGAQQFRASDGQRIEGRLERSPLAAKELIAA